MKLLTISLIFGLLALTAVQCGKHDSAVDPNACTLSSPAVNTPWIQQIISGTDCVMFAGAEISTCTYNGKTCVYVDNSASSQAICDKLLYDCKGQKMLDGTSSSASWDDFKKNVTNKVKIWSK